MLRLLRLLNSIPLNAAIAALGGRENDDHIEDEVRLLKTADDAPLDSDFNFDDAEAF